jgi:hypothetical protein
LYTDFEDLNAFVYHRVRGAVFDGVIWCLGPYVDDTRDYGTLRLWLARAARALVRRWFRIED